MIRVRGFAPVSPSGSHFTSGLFTSGSYNANRSRCAKSASCKNGFLRIWSDIVTLSNQWVGAGFYKLCERELRIEEFTLWPSQHWWSRRCRRFLNISSNSDLRVVLRNFPILQLKNREFMWYLLPATLEKITRYLIKALWKTVRCMKRRSSQPICQPQIHWRDINYARPSIYSLRQDSPCKNKHIP